MESTELKMKDFYNFKIKNLVVGNLILNPSYLYTKEMENRKITHTQYIDLDMCEKIINVLLKSRHSKLFEVDFDSEAGRNADKICGKGIHRKSKGQIFEGEYLYVNLRTIEVC